MSIAQQKIHDALCSINSEQFDFKLQEIGGDICVLVTPENLGVDWCVDTLILRSIIYRRSDYKPISVSFDKFFNNTEQPHLYPDPNEFNGHIYEEKLDGATLLISKTKGELIVRTRGTFSAFVHETGDEIKDIFKNNPKITNNKWVDSENYTLIFEHITPNNKIVLNYDNPELLLIAARNHEDLSYLSFDDLNHIAEEIGVNRPRVYKFDNISEIVDICQDQKDFEGYVLSYNNNQNRIKFKTLDYLKKHSFRSNASSKNILELYSDQNYPNFDDFKNYIINNFDFECWTMVEDLVTQVCVFKKEVDLDIKDAQKFVDNNSSLTDKEFTLRVLDKDWKSVAFSLRKGKALPDRLIKNKLKEKL